MMKLALVALQIQVCCGAIQWNAKGGAKWPLNSKGEALEFIDKSSGPGFGHAEALHVKSKSANQAKMDMIRRLQQSPNVPSAGSFLSTQVPAQMLDVLLGTKHTKGIGHLQTMIKDYFDGLGPQNHLAVCVTHDIANQHAVMVSRDDSVKDSTKSGGCPPKSPRGYTCNSIPRGSKFVFGKRESGVAYLVTAYPVASCPQDATSGGFDLWKEL